MLSSTSDDPSGKMTKRMHKATIQKKGRRVVTRSSRFSRFSEDVCLDFSMADNRKSFLNTFVQKNAKSIYIEHDNTGMRKNQPEIHL
jgi:hypothetical protein